MGIESISGSKVTQASYSAPEVSTTQVSKPQFSTEPVAETTTPAGRTQYDGQVFSEESLKGNAPSDSTVKQAISDINKRINPNTVAQYGYHEETNRVTIKIVDKESDKTIKEFPAEETLDMIAKVWELAGMFVDEKK